MPDGKLMLNDLDLEIKIKDFTPAEQFLVRELYSSKKQCLVCNQTDFKQHAFNYTGLASFLGMVFLAIYKFALGK